MGQIEQKKRHNKKTYRAFLFRVRRASELERLLLDHAQNGETSVNYLISLALCKYLGCDLPHREYTRTTRTRLYTSPDLEE